MKTSLSKLLAALLALCLLLAVLPGTARAKSIDHAVESGYIYFDPETGTITGSDKQITKADIPTEIEGVRVTGIWSKAFEECKRLSSVTIPNSVIYIEGSAFWECNSLTDVFYSGSQADWEKINIDNRYDRNDPLLSANVHYKSPTSTPATPAPAAASKSVSVTVNGIDVPWPDAAPFIDQNNRTMVPLRAVADAMGLDVNWNANSREAFFSHAGKTIFFPIDSTSARSSNGQSISMNTAAVIVNGRTYAPVRYLAEFFGYHVVWNATSRTVIISS